MKFGAFVRDLTVYMHMLNNDFHEDFDNVFFYLRFEDKLYTESILELRYCDDIGKYAVIFKADKD